MTNPEADIRLVDVKGRKISVRQLKDAQLILMGRDAKTLGDENADQRRRFNAAAYIMDAFESAIVTDQDKDYVLDLTRKGQLEISDFQEFLSVFHTEPTEVKKPVRRGRPPRKSA
jgi:hypothetical protein